MLELIHGGRVIQDNLRLPGKLKSATGPSDFIRRPHKTQGIRTSDNEMSELCAALCRSS